MGERVLNPSNPPPKPRIEPLTNTTNSEDVKAAVDRLNQFDGFSSDTNGLHLAISTVLAALTAAEQARDEALEALKRIDDTLAPTLRAWVHDRYGRRITWRTAWDFAASIIHPAKES